MTSTEPASPPTAAIVRAPDARRTPALLVGVAATVAFVVLRFVVALGGHAPMALDVWWDDLMFSMLTDPGIVIAWVPAVAGGTIGMIVIGILAWCAVEAWRDRRSARNAAPPPGHP